MAVGYLRSVQQIREVVDSVRKGEKVLHTMEMARPVVRRGVVRRRRRANLRGDS